MALQSDTASWLRAQARTFPSNLGVLSFKGAIQLAHQAPITMTKLRIVPLDDVVVFPGMTVTLPVEVGSDTHVLLVPKQGQGFARVGVIAEVSEKLRLSGHDAAVSLVGLQRGVPGAAETDRAGVLRVPVEERPDAVPPAHLTVELEREYRAVVEEILQLRGDDGRISAFLRSISSPGALADTSGYSPDLNVAQKIQLLEELDVVERLKLALRLQQDRLTELMVRKRIREDVESGAQKQQREYFLRKQMDSIRKELGEDDASVSSDYREKIAAAGMPDAVREQAERELSRLERLGDANAEAATIRTYLDWLLAVPWAKRSEERLDPAYAREVLDADHEGLDDVKKRITEYLAVRKLRAERGMVDTKRSGVILTLIGPPGTGKTSIGESIAKATGRKFERMSLGGIRDEADIRGHRRTYIGALPGRLVRALRDAGTMNPVIMLDEVDKIGADWRGDPASALLEVLDPAQNHSFRDHYLDVELDLSQVLFIATANVADTIPGPLLDRMEVIRFDGYTTQEKVAIARGHLWPRQLERNGLRADEATVTDDVLRVVVTDYTREAGVRQLERELGTLLRKTATQIASATRKAPIAVDAAAVRDALGRPKVFHEAAVRTSVPGVATGLAVTGAGGDVLFVEAASMSGNGLVLTGQLGDVMKESARIALTYVQSHASELGIDPGALEGRELHVHVPAGAIPKDGPSAGVTMVTAIASLLTGRPVKGTIGMTGEVTLQGRVLPIGGLKQKVLAAHAAGLTEVIVPERNAQDLDDVPRDVRDRMTFHIVGTAAEVLEHALEPVAAMPIAA
jgi:ATP-dependent Lon protease